ncbi:uncharacterized protein LOC106160985 [Lingula anatina]|uniref:Uncharacterized protein LOC106160985 n=1 Tax=Lingula anatina TaxID=7574 RepID=A0A1S3I5Y9_LINAN|nr:uncharacterized protein LOC106160985 [Lingula anatina]|eukprot:XP_013393261.1 uncharacterized protein LOC106160985 [Lingula anatina]
MREFFCLAILSLVYFVVAKPLTEDRIEKQNNQLATFPGSKKDGKSNKLSETLKKLDEIKATPDVRDGDVPKSGLDDYINSDIESNPSEERLFDLVANDEQFLTFLKTYIHVNKPELEAHATVYFDQQALERVAKLEKICEIDEKFGQYLEAYLSSSGDRIKNSATSQRSASAAVHYTKFQKRNGLSAARKKRFISGISGSSPTVEELLAMLEHQKQNRGGYGNSSSRWGRSVGSRKSTRRSKPKLAEELLDLLQKYQRKANGFGGSASRWGRSVGDALTTIEQ